MRRTTYWRAALCVAAILGGGAVTPTAPAFIGISSAEAKPYYTRKRVNGRWVTGRFAKRSAMAARETRRSARYRNATAAIVEEPVAPRETRVVSLPRSVVEERPRVQAPVAAAPLVSLSEDERLSKLREALRARANTLTTDTITTAPSAPRAREPQSVTLDFVAGVKTTVFSDGTMVAEPFDVNALRSLAGSPDARPSAAR